jgi:hypothetical protein
LNCLGRKTNSMTQHYWQCPRCDFQNDEIHEVCWNCETERGWEYSGPNEVDYNAPSQAERAEMQAKIQRELKR